RRVEQLRLRRRFLRRLALCRLENANALRQLDHDAFKLDGPSDNTRLDEEPYVRMTIERDFNQSESELRRGRFMLLIVGADVTGASGELLADRHHFFVRAVRSVSSVRERISVVPYGCTPDAQGWARWPTTIMPT